MIHSLYREISDKHAALYREFQVRTEEVAVLSEQNKRLLEENTRVKAEKFGMENDNKELRREVELLKEQIIRIEGKMKSWRSKDGEWRIDKLMVNKELYEEKSTGVRLGKELANCE